MPTQTPIYLSIRLEDKLEEIRQRTLDGQHQVYDPVRKKFVAWQPEEMVRQLLILYLAGVFNIPYSRMAVERGLVINGQRKRFDLVIYDKKGKPWMLAECKAFDVTISTQTAIQTAHYNSQLLCPYLLMTNGPVCLLCKVDFNSGEVQFLSSFPESV
jgi:hypothetical protein